MPKTKSLPQYILVRRIKVKKREVLPVNVSEVLTATPSAASHVYGHYDVAIDVHVIREGLARIPAKPLIICPVEFVSKSGCRRETLFCERHLIDKQLSIESLITAAVNLPKWLS
jgi:hypothetical protein